MRCAAQLVQPRAGPGACASAARACSPAFSRAALAALASFSDVVSLRCRWRRSGCRCRRACRPRRRRTRPRAAARPRWTTSAWRARPRPRRWTRPRRRAPTASPTQAVHLAAFACATARAPRAVDQAVMADPLHSPARYTLINRATEQRAPLPARQHRRPQPHPRRAGLGGRAAQPRVGQGGAAR